MSDITLFHVTFHEGGVEVVYAEDWDNTDLVAQQHTIAIPHEIAGVDLQDAIESLQAVTDNGLSYLAEKSRMGRRGDLSSKLKGPGAKIRESRMDGEGRL